MIKAKHKTLAFFILFVCKMSCITFPPKGANGKGYRFVFGPSIGFYNINTKHAAISSSKLSASIGFRKEIRCDQLFQNYFLFGVDYFFHGVNFNSYYFNQDTLQLYDKNFSAKYSLKMNELNIPLQFKHSFTRENNSLFSPYMMLGYHLRYMLPARVTVTKDGDVQVDEFTNVKFKHAILTNKINCFVSASLGFQKNKINSSSMGFFLEANYRYGFSQYLFQTNYSASSLYVNGSHLCILLGVTF